MRGSRFLGFFAIIVGLALSGCHTLERYEWNGPQILHGGGGIMKRDGGIEIWIQGEPDHDYSPIVVIETETTGTIGVESYLFNVLKEQTLAQGGDGFILMTKDARHGGTIVTNTSTTAGTASLYGNRAYINTTSTGVAVAVPIQHNTYRAMIFRYTNSEKDVSEPAKSATIDLTTKSQEFVNNGSLASATAQNLPPSKFKPVGVQVGKLNLARGLDPERIRDIIAYILLANDWEVKDKADDHVVGHIKRRSSEADLTLVFDSEKIQMYCEGWEIDKKTGTRLKPELPDSWIEDIRDDLNERLAQAVH